MLTVRSLRFDAHSDVTIFGELYCDWRGESIATILLGTVESRCTRYRWLVVSLDFVSRVSSVDDDARLDSARTFMPP